MLAAPFALEDLKKIVAGENSCPPIDLAASKIKDMALLTYIYNLNLTDVTIEVTNSTLEQRRNLFMSYVNHKTTVEVKNLLNTYLKFLLVLKNIDVHEEDLEYLDQDVIFSNEEIHNLIESDTELREVIERAAFLLDGVVVHMMLSINDINIEADEDFGKVGILRDPNWIGHTWINLFKSPVYNAYYYSVMPALRELVYFPYQYSESIYKGKSLLDYLCADPWLMALMQISTQNLERSKNHDDSPSV